MKITTAILSMFVFATVACSASTEDARDSPSVDTDFSSSAHAQMVKQGGCSEEEISMGWWDFNGVCYGPSSGGSATGCPSCETNFDACEATCAKKAPSLQKTCTNSCVRIMSLCYSHC